MLLHKPLRTILAFVLVLTILSCQKTKQDNKITIGKIETIHSDVLNEDRPVWIYVPNADANPPDTSRHYPVLYLLDGDGHFHSVTGLLQHLTVNDLVPEMIVVAIPNTDRSRDLTPTHSMKMPDGSSGDFLKTTGGAENFTKFIETELMPYVDSHYPTAPYRVLFGHSFGGLFAINAFVNHNDLFDCYLAIDPSLWWDEHKLLKQADSVLRREKFNNKTLFVSVANTMEPGMDTLRVIGDTTGNTDHIRSIIRFSKTAALTSRSSGLNFGWKYYNEDTHGSVPLISEYDALRFMFDFYKAPTDPETTADQEAAHYKRVSLKMGYNVLPPEGRVNGYAYYLMSIKKFDLAKGYLEMNIRNYPKSQNVYDSMGDYYLAVQDTTKAIEYFEKALQIGEVEATRTKLESLEKH